MHIKTIFSKRRPFSTTVNQAQIPPSSDVVVPRDHTTQYSTMEMAGMPSAAAPSTDAAAMHMDHVHRYCIVRLVYF